MVTAAMKFKKKKNKTPVPWKKHFDKHKQYIKKPRDITLRTKFPIVKAMGFPVVMYDGCESCTIKKIEH